MKNSLPILVLGTWWTKNLPIFVLRTRRTKKPPVFDLRLRRTMNPPVFVLRSEIVSRIVIGPVVACRVEGRSRCSDRTSGWKIELKIETWSELKKPGENWSEGAVGRRRKRKCLSTFQTRVKNKRVFVLSAPKITDDWFFFLKKARRTKKNIFEEIVPPSRHLPSDLRANLRGREPKMRGFSIFGTEDRRLKMTSVLRSSRPKIEDGKRCFVVQDRRSKMKNYSEIWSIRIRGVFRSSGFEEWRTISWSADVFLSLLMCLKHIEKPSERRLCRRTS